MMRVEIGNSLARTVIRGPQLKIFRSVIESITVFVVNSLAFAQRTTKDALHDPPMFGDPFAFHAEIAIAVFRMHETLADAAIVNAAG
jgi:hypothetical protein